MMVNVPKLKIFLGCILFFLLGCDPAVTLLNATAVGNGIFTLVTYTFYISKLNH